MVEPNPGGTYALGAQFRDVGIDKSTKTLSRTILGQVPVATVDGPKKIDEFGCNESDVDNPIRTDEAHPPYFVEEFRGQRSLKLDLLHNYDTFVRKDHHALDLGEKVLWLEHKLKTQPGVPLKQVLANVDFFTSRGVLKLMGSAPFTAFPWKIIAFKYQGVIFVFDVKPDYDRGMDSAKSDYMGHKFHQFVTASSPTGKPGTNQPLNTYEKYMVMLRSSFECEGKRLTCLFSCKMDCADPDGNGIELKTEVADLTPSKRLAMKYAGWWMECNLANIREVIVGEKPYGNSRKFPNLPVSATVVAVKSVKVDELPHLSYGTVYWKPEKFTFCLHRFLSEVKTTLDNAPEGTLLIAELASSDARSIDFHLEKLGQSTHDFFYKELDKRIAKYL
ncbi:CRE-DOM-3 protein [Aphelenchoides avenae]|nr:CRE-DOM-3 protein [Aphelenchus avenae]